MVRLVPLLALAAPAALLPAVASAQSVSDVAARGACSTAGLEGISRQLADAQRCMRPGAFVRFAPHPGIELSSSRVHPYAQATTRDALHRAAADTPLTVNSAFRTIADQYVLYHSGGCGLAATPGRSNHQSGRAVDLANYGAARSAMSAQGCSWLGSSDPVHFDCPGSDRRSDSVLAFQKLWNLNHPDDRIDEDGLYGDQTSLRLGRTPAAGFAHGLCDTSPEPMPSGGRLIGVVYETPDTDARIDGAHVRILETDHEATVGADGLWQFDVASGTYTVEASADGYVTGRHTCTVDGAEVWCSVGLMPGEAQGKVSGVVFEDTGAGFTDASIRLAGASVVVTSTGETLETDESGSFETSLPPGEHTFSVSKEGYAPASRRCTVEPGAEAWCSVGLAPAEATGTLEGTVHVAGDPSRRVVGAEVEVVETAVATRSREGDGRWSLELPAGPYTLEVRGEGLVTTDERCEVVAGESRDCSVGVELSDPDAARVEVPDGAEGDAGAEAEAPDATGSRTLTGGCSAAGARAPALPLLGAALLLLVLAARRRA